ncbi:hypothetical protein ABZ860_13540 [Microbispora sp. NPDC046973]|uniref:hypothetical protein n=1 Tax=Microbispora sp. NPDC046973 TaxID=3155022 RepID=UPI0033FF5325
MPLCTAVLAAALLSGPAAVPPDPAPPGTRAATDNNNAAPSSGRPQLASLPGMAPQPGEFPFTLPQAPPWMAPSGMDGRSDDSAAAPRSPAGASRPGASGASARPGADGGRPATAGDTAGDTAAGGQNGTKYVPMIDPKTRDVFIQPVFASGKPGEAPQPFTFGPTQGIQSTRTYPPPRGEKTAQQKTARPKTIARPRQHQRPRD